MTSQRSEVAVIGSGFAGSLMARVLATLGYDVVLLERGTHPRFAIGESSTPLANLSLERLSKRYGLTDCYDLAAHGRWLEKFPDVRRGLKRGFTFYRHHPGDRPDDGRLVDERLLVAASPNAAVADSHWLRADVDHHFVRRAIAAGVDYRDRVDLTGATIDDGGARLVGTRAGETLELRTDFVIDASGPGGFLAHQLAIPSGLERTETRSAIVFSHFDGVRLMSDVIPNLPAGPYPDDWAAVHHVIDEGWMYSLRFDDGVTSAGFLLSPSGVGTLGLSGSVNPNDLWTRLLDRYPTIAASFRDARPLMPLAFRPCIQHRLTRAAGARWAMLPHAYAFVDPLFSTGIAWSLRAVERLSLLFESRESGTRVPSESELARYEAMVAREADQIDRIVAGAYEAGAHFDLFAAHAMIYFATVSFSEVRQRLEATGASHPAWSGFLGVGDQVLEPLALESLDRLRRITEGDGRFGTEEQRRDYEHWVRTAIEPRNIGGFGDPERHNLYPLDIDLLVERHEVLGMTRHALLDALPMLRGTATRDGQTPISSGR
jgi:FADH2 O2-dependent halogenase